MHVPASMLNGAICPVTLAVSALGMGVAATVVAKSKKKTSSVRFAAITALIFALNILELPIHGGWVYLVGAALGVSFLGIPFAILSMMMVLTVRAIFPNYHIELIGHEFVETAFFGIIGIGIVFSIAFAFGKRLSRWQTEVV